MNEQGSAEQSTNQPPLNEDKKVWRIKWKRQGQNWRTEPEIDIERQEYLTEQRKAKPDIERGIYPFKDIKLNRADIEWLLATHESGGIRGPVDWSDEHQHEREGLDLRGADLRQVDLHQLPLACTHFGVTWEDWKNLNVDQRNAAAALMDGVNLEDAQLQNADLREVHIENARFFRSHLEHTSLRGAHLKNSTLQSAHLNYTYFIEADLRGTDLSRTYMEATRLEDAILSDERHIGPYLVDIRWINVNIALVKWSQVRMLADENEARSKRSEGKTKSIHQRIYNYERAVRANRQLAIVLHQQGLNEEAAHFGYRAQILQRTLQLLEGSQPQVNLLQRVRKLSSYIFSWFLDLLAGYGYQPAKTLFWYLLVVFGFALIYYYVGPLDGHSFSPGGALVFSLTSFHGRGFIPGTLTVEGTVIKVAASEAVIGLFIEISFIATFTQRFFAK